MLLKIVLTLFLPVMCNAEIKLNITIASNKHDAHIQFTGADNKVITEHEKALFNVTLAKLQRGMRKELGRVPDGIFLKDPTPYGNLFHKFKWPEVQRSITIEDVKILEVYSVPVDVKTEVHNNNATVDTSTNLYMFAQVVNNVNTEWSLYGLPEEDNVSINMTLNFHKSKWQFLMKWRDTNTRSTNLQFGKPGNKKMVLKPGKGVIRKLKAKKTTFILQVDYKAELIGNLIADYERLYGKYHFYAPNVKNIMKRERMVNEIRTRERISISCYTDPTLGIYDRDTGAELNRRSPSSERYFMYRNRIFWNNHTYFG